jgi:formylglycine-generating enzyme required for sulfatase activity
MGQAGKKLDEEPVHDVVIGKPFWMGKTEVTNGQYRLFLKESGYRGGEKPGPFYLRHFASGRKSDMPDEDGCPVCYVNWDQASAFCRWLTTRERKAGRLPAGYEYRLPTEAEWEYACRAGTGGDFAGPVEDLAWYSLTALDHRNQPVGTRLPNAWGLCDMHGNVWEWCRDWLGDYPEGEAKDPTGPEKGLFKVIRGGSWENAADMCRSANRGSLAVPEANPNLGFRIVLGIEHGGGSGNP